MFEKNGIATEQVPDSDAATKDTLEARLNKMQGWGLLIVEVGIVRIESTGQLLNYIGSMIAPELAGRLQPIKVELVTTDQAQARITDLSRSHHFIAHAPFKFAAGQQDILVYRQGVRLRSYGRMSMFGGPDDHGVKPDEGLALLSTKEAGIKRFQQLFKPELTAGTEPLARQLDADGKSYLACRWNYKVTPRSVLLDDQCIFAVSNPANGRLELATAVDWGPNLEKTGRNADLSPYLASKSKLDLKTDADCQVDVYLPPSYVLPEIVPPASYAAAPAGSFRERLAQSALEQYKLFNGCDEHQSPLMEQIKRYWNELHGVNAEVPEFPGVREPWSAVFVSWNVLKANPPAPFKYAAQHSQFVFEAIRNEQGFLGKSVNKAQPRIGDIIQNSRTKDVIDFDYASKHNDYPSHSAIVVGYEEANGARYALTIGGNEGDTVRRRRVRLDKDGFIVQPEEAYYIAVVQSPD